MSTSIMAVVVRLVRGWVRLYTAGLPPAVRDGRRAEVASDLWEQECDAGAVCCRPDDTAWQMFSRWLLGISADLSWRFEQMGAHRRAGKIPERSGNMNTLVAQGALLALAVLLTLGFAAGGVALIAATSSTSQYYPENVILGALGTSGAVIFLIGLYITRWRPLLGGGLLVAGAIPMGLMVVWLVYPPILVLLMAFFGIEIGRAHV